MTMTLSENFRKQQSLPKEQREKLRKQRKTLKQRVNAYRLNNLHMSSKGWKAQLRAGLRLEDR